MQLRKFDSSVSEGAGTDDSLTVVVGIDLGKLNDRPKRTALAKASHTIA